MVLIVLCFSVEFLCYLHITSNAQIRHGYEGGSESSVKGVITLLIDMIGCCIIP